MSPDTPLRSISGPLRITLRERISTRIRKQLRHKLQGTNSQNTFLSEWLHQRLGSIDSFLITPDIHLGSILFVTTLF